jgi:DNA-binding IscR family transcriptional regulator
MISAKCKYGLKAMVYINGPRDKAAVLISEIAEAENIPKKYLDVILLELKTNGMLVSKKGKGAAISSRAAPATFEWPTSCGSSVERNLRPFHASPS